MGLSQRRTRLLERLGSRKTRERERLVLVEGIRGVEEALAGGAVPRFAVVSPKLSTSAAGEALAPSLASVDVEHVTDDELAALSDAQTTQGVLLVCREPDGSLTRLSRGRVLVLDGVQDPGNAGTLIRAAVAFGLDAVVFLDGTVDPWGAKTVRASAGMAFRCPVLSGGAEELLERLTESAIPLYVADAGGQDADAFRGADAFALVVGNEGRGVRGVLVDVADAVVAIPMSGPAESLNVGVAGSLLMHVLTRRGAGE
jgi:TrmH family RNA methyltransferase